MSSVSKTSRTGEELRTVLRALWARASSHYDEHRLVVRYYGDGIASLTALDGYFHPDPDKREARGLPPTRRIGIHRVPSPRPQDEPDLRGPHVLEDTCTLAHEYGHFLVWLEHRDSPRWRATFEAAQRRDRGAQLVDEDAALILAEEADAWRRGRAVLRELDFRDWDTFDEHERLGLSVHRERLGLPPVEDEPNAP